MLAQIEKSKAFELAALWGSMFPIVLRDMIGSLAGLAIPPVMYGWIDLQPLPGV